MGRRGPCRGAGRASAAGSRDAKDLSDTVEDLFEVVVAVSTAIVGAGLLGVALSGYLFARLNLLQRALLAGAALGMLTPAAGEGILFHWTTDLAGLVLAVAVLLPQWLKKRIGAVDGQVAEKSNQI